MLAIALRAPAKLNLFLHILGRRADGYHRIESLVVFTDLADTLAIEPAATLSLQVDGAFATMAGDDAQNLVLKAARALQGATGCSAGARITLTKHIPVGAGLGGGSADAAVALTGLNQLWQLGLMPDQLRALAVTLGADVAMCIDAKPAMISGIGEVIVPLVAPLSLPPYALLVHPRVPLLTKDVYAAMRLTHRASMGQAYPRDLTALMATQNDMQAAAIALNPTVGEVLQALVAMLPEPRLVRMTGSGACCFALVDTQVDAEQAAASIAHVHPDWWVKAVQISL